MSTPRVNLFVLGRNYVLVSKSGRAIEFVKGKPVHVPPDVIKEAIGIGALPADGADAEQFFKEPELTKAPSDPQERGERIVEVIRKLVERNDRDDFTAAGYPNAKVVSKLLGWRVEPREVSVAYRAYTEEQTLAREQDELDARLGNSQEA